jgi:hypothetical protein
MKEFFGLISIIITLLFLATATIFGLSYLGYLSTAFYQPRYEEIRRQTFEQSRAFNEGMVRDLENIKMQYMTATDTEKVGLRAVVIHRFSVYPQDQLPPDLQLFYSQLTTGAIK